MSNYPPGVTGNEYAIAGPDYEKESEVECWHCGNTDGNLEQGYNREKWIVCGECGETTDIEDSSEDDEADYRYARFKDEG